MTTNFIPVQPVMIRASANRSDLNRRKPSSSSASWWTPLFGWSSDPDYIGSDGVAQEKKSSRSVQETDLDAKPASRSRFAPGGFTEEKAKQLRMLTAETYHDAMYHSAIASRLASDFKNLGDLE